jgi:type IV secretory pathway VirB2 component (pilin)
MLSACTENSHSTRFAFRAKAGADCLGDWTIEEVIPASAGAADAGFQRGSGRETGLHRIDHYIAGNLADQLAVLGIGRCRRMAGHHLVMAVGRECFVAA